MTKLLTFALMAGAGVAAVAGAWAAARPPAPAPSPAPVPRNNPAGPQPVSSDARGAGELAVIDRDGRIAALCPLEHTAVEADISGPLARVTVTQLFKNNSANKVEAVYTFPLPNRAAVDDMTITVGDRVIKGSIKRRAEARKIFDDARRNGHVAALLDQERPNIFTQAVTNLAPGAAVKVVISYVETVHYDAGSYEFRFPMVVGPRYLAGAGNVPDASKINPPVTHPSVRAGHDISVNVNLDAGVGIESLVSKTHRVAIDRQGSSRARIRLENQREIPNRDFLLSYDVAGKKMQDAVLVHRDPAKLGGFFTLLLQPPDRVAASEVAPKELVFVVDTSGSMDGFPIEKSKEVVKLTLDNLYPGDTFNLITFAGDTHVLFPQPVPATPDNIRRAQQFLLSRRGSGGTEMMKAIRAALDPSDQQDHLRIVCFLTDGYIGNDMEVVGEVKRHPNARVFAFGIGSSVNRFLLDKMAEEGRGEVEYVALNDDGSAAAARFHDRVRNPLLTDIEVDFGGLGVTDVYPRRHADLFAAKPLVITGRYDRAGEGAIRVRGRRGGAVWEKTIAVRLPENEPAHDVLATLWARTRIEHLMSEDWVGLQRGQMRGDLEESITQLGLQFRLMTQFTSFVAVEQSTVISGGVPTKVEVPVELPHGVSFEGVFGGRVERDAENKFVGFSAAGSVVLRRQQMQVIPYRSTVPMSEAAPVVLPVAPVPLARDESRRAKAAPGEAMAKVDPQLAGIQPGVAVQVKLWLNDDSPAVLAKLKSLGFTLVKKLNGKMVLGSVDAGRIAGLAALDDVLYVSKDLGQP